jgi:hypothetical protein
MFPMTTQRSTMVSTRGLRQAGALGLFFATALACSQATPSDPPDVTRPPPGGMRPVPGMNLPGTDGMSTPPAGGSSGGDAQVKFCNGVQSDKGAVDIEMTIGAGSNPVKVASGSCLPAKGNACATIKAGPSRITFRMGGKEVFAQDIAIEAGQQYLVVSTVDRGTQKIGLGGGKLAAGAQCAAADPFAGSSPGGTGGATVGKFCHNLALDDGNGGKLPVTFDLTIGDVRLSATSNDCSSPVGQMCIALPPGSTTASLYRDGQMLTSAPVTIEAGKEYMFGLKLQGTSPVITGNALSANPRCAAAGAANASGLPTLGAAPPPAPPPGAASAVKICNRLPAGVAEVMIGDNLVLTAKPGECSSVKGMPCSAVAAGTAALVVAIDGDEVLNNMVEFVAGREKILIVKSDALTDQTVPAGMMCSTYEP